AVGLRGTLWQGACDQLHLVIRAARLGDLRLIALAFVGVVGGVGVGRILHAVPAGLGLHDDLVFAHFALLVENRDQGLVGRAACHVGAIGEAFDDPQQILGRLLPRALSRFGVLGCGEQLRLR